MGSALNWQGPPTVSDTAFAASWDAVTTIAPSKNAVYDQMILKATIASPTFTTSITTPLIIGGTGTTDDLILRTTSGVGASGADMIFQTGNNGATEAMRILYDGKVGIGTTAPATTLEVAGSITAAVNGTIGFRYSAGDSNQYAYITNNGSSPLTLVGGKYTSNDTTVAIQFYTYSKSPAVAITNAGNVGIGTTTPLAKLSVNGGLHVGGDSDPGDNNLLVDGTLDITGTLTNRGAYASTYHIDTTPAAQSVANGGTVAIPSFSGMLIVNNHSNGHVTIYLCGGGTVVVVANTVTQVGTLAYSSGNAGYTWTSNYGSTATYGFLIIRTRATA